MCVTAHRLQISKLKKAPQSKLTPTGSSRKARKKATEEIVAAAEVKKSKTNTRKWRNVNKKKTKTRKTVENLGQLKIYRPSRLPDLCQYIHTHSQTYMWQPQHAARHRLPLFVHLATQKRRLLTMHTYLSQLCNSNNNNNCCALLQCHSSAVYVDGCLVDGK